MLRIEVLYTTVKSTLKIIHDNYSKNYKIPTDSFPKVFHDMSIRHKYVNIYNYFYMLS